MDLIDMLVADNSNKHFLFVAGYRDDEMPDEHPAMAHLNEMKNDSRLYTTLELGNLSESDRVRRIVAARQIGRASCSHYWVHKDDYRSSFHSGGP